MVNSRAIQLDETFFALSDPTRRAIVAQLSTGDSTVAEILAPFELSAPAISKHLRVLERAGLLVQERVGRTRRCRLDPRPLQNVAAFVEDYRHFWEGQLDSLAEYLQALPSEEESSAKKTAAEAPQTVRKKSARSKTKEQKGGQKSASKRSTSKRPN